MSQKHPIETILEKFKLGKCTGEELAILEQWYQSLNTGNTEFKVSGVSIKTLKDDSWNRIFAFINDEAKRNSKKRLLHITRAAAAVFIGVMFFLGYYFFIAERKGLEYIALLTKKGELLQVTLPDSSIVWVSGGSSLRYPKSFDQSRDVFLEDGEAYFEVEHNEKVPFVVHTPSGISTRVLGTKFSVKSLATLADARVKVISGKVQVQDSLHTFGILTKNQELRIDKVSKAFQIATIDSLEITDWKQGKIFLTDVSFEELALALENSFKIPVTISSQKLAHCRISISYKLADDIKSILKDISIIYTINIKQNEKGITISGKGCS